MAELLIKNGADTSLTNNLGKTAFNLIHDKNLLLLYKVIDPNSYELSIADTLDLPLIELKKTAFNTNLNQPKDSINSETLNDPNNLFPNTKSAYNLNNILSKINVYFKISDSIVDAFRFIFEPTIEHAEILTRDFIHLQSMAQGSNIYYPLSLSTINVLNLFYQGENEQASIQAVTTIGFALLRVATGPIGSTYSAILITFIGYKAATNLYSLYLNYGTTESQFKSNIAYGKLSNYWGFKDTAKNYLINAMNNIIEGDKDLVYKQERYLEIQQIAEELGLPCMLCELGLVDNSDCSII